MLKVKIHGWDAKPQTMLRYIKPGDIFLFKLSEGIYGVGRILTRVSIGHAVELFDIFLEEPLLKEADLERVCRITSPIIVDSYSLFDRRLEGEWRIVGHHEGFSPGESDNAWFYYGSANSFRKIDIFENEEAISNDAVKKFPPFSPNGDWHVKELLLPLVKR